MSDKTKITWADASWNVTTGCTKASAGCKHCYAERQWPRLAGNPTTRYYGRPFTDVRSHPEVLEQPLRWQRPRRIFVNSMSDLFHDDVASDFIARVFAVMAAATWHQFMVLTKRPGRAIELLSDGDFLGQVTRGLASQSKRKTSWPLPNVKVGVSVEDQKTASDRGLALQVIAALGWDTWVSYEPALGAVNWRPWLPFLTEAVAGAESGPAARPMHPSYPRALRDACLDAGIHFHFKQWGPWLPEAEAQARKLKAQKRHVFEDGQVMVWVGTAHGGRELDGRLWDSPPAPRRTHNPVVGQAGDRVVQLQGD